MKIIETKSKESLRLFWKWLWTYCTSVFLSCLSVSLRSSTMPLSVSVVKAPPSIPGWWCTLSPSSLYWSRSARARYLVSSPRVTRTKTSRTPSAEMRPAYHWTNGNIIAISICISWRVLLLKCLRAWQTLIHPSSHIRLGYKKNGEWMVSYDLLFSIVFKSKSP